MKPNGKTSVRHIAEFLAHSRLEDVANPNGLVLPGIATSVSLVEQTAKLVKELDADNPRLIAANAMYTITGFALSVLREALTREFDNTCTGEPLSTCTSRDKMAEAFQNIASFLLGTHQALRYIQVIACTNKTEAEVKEWMKQDCHCIESFYSVLRTHIPEFNIGEIDPSQPMN